MSHVSIASGERIQQNELDLEATRLACDELGLVFCRDTTTYQWFGKWVGDYHASDAAYKQVDPKTFGLCKHMIRRKWTQDEEIRYKKQPEARPYEIGLVEMPDGGLTAMFDHYGSGREIMKLVGGKTCGLLMATIAKYKTILKAATVAGHYVKSIEKLENGKVHVVIGVKGTGTITGANKLNLK